MPELPEVETLRIQLSRLIQGLTVLTVTVRKQKSFIGRPDNVYGARIISLRRIAKILFIGFDNGLSIAVHLKMSGQLIYRGLQQKYSNFSDPYLINLPNSHTRVIINFTNGDRLFFNDMRMFGWMRIVKDQEAGSKRQEIYKNTIPSIHSLVKNIGPDPLSELNSKKFYRILHSSKQPVKLVLMDQEKIAGVGNIYANDALFLAGIHPKKPANIISEKKSDVLMKNLQKILSDAIKWKGASKQLYRDAYGRKGQVQDHFQVYDREGETCYRCGREIKKIKLGGRGTYFCPYCQRV